MRAPCSRACTRTCAITRTCSWSRPRPRTWPATTSCSWRCRTGHPERFRPSCPPTPSWSTAAPITGSTAKPTGTPSTAASMPARGRMAFPSSWWAASMPPRRLSQPSSGMRSPEPHALQHPGATHPPCRWHWLPDWRPGYCCPVASPPRWPWGRRVRARPRGSTCWRARLWARPTPTRWATSTGTFPRFCRTCARPAGLASRRSP